MNDFFRPSPTAVFENLTAAVASSVSTGVAPQGCIVRVKAVDQPIRVVIGPGTPVAAATSLYMSAGETERFHTQAGDKVAVIRAGAADGAVNIVFMSK